MIFIGDCKVLEGLLGLIAISGYWKGIYGLQGSFQHYCIRMRG